MNKFEIILLSAVIGVIAVRIYQKYVKKNQGKQGGGNTQSTTLSSSSKETDYEPYSKKKE